MSPPVFTRSIQFPSLRSNIRTVETFLVTICEDLRLSTDMIDRIMIAVTEAVNNAIIHGNKSDPDRRVDLACECDDQWIRFRVKDEGGGFVPEAVPDPRFSDNLLKEGGRGILIIRAFMDEVEFRRNENGMEVWMGIKLKVES